MNQYICKGCGRDWFSTASPEHMIEKLCAACGGAIIAPAAIASTIQTWMDYEEAMAEIQILAGGRWAEETLMRILPQTPWTVLDVHKMLAAGGTLEGVETAADLNAQMFGRVMYRSTLEFGAKLNTMTAEMEQAQKALRDFANALQSMQGRHKLQRFADRVIWRVDKLAKKVCAFFAWGAAGR